jgi:hypothetical protein
MTEKKTKNLTLSRKKKSSALPNSEETESADRLLRETKGLAMTDSGSSRKIEEMERNKDSESFYAKVLEAAEALDFEMASGTEGLDDEITLLRVKIKALLEKDPENIELMMAATSMLAKLVKTRYSISKEQKKGLAESIKNINKDIGVPLGVAVLSKKL